MSDDTVREDQGYRRDMPRTAIPRTREEPVKIRIEYTHGIMAGQLVWVGAAIAGDLIRRGYARVVGE